MQHKPDVATDAVGVAHPPASPEPTFAEISATAPGSYRVIRRNGKQTPFDHSKIRVAMLKAFLAVEGNGAAASRRVNEVVERLTAQVETALTRSRPADSAFHIEDIQDQVELCLMRAGEHKVARAYVLYREERARERASRKEAAAEASPAAAADAEIRITLDDGETRPLERERLRRLVVEACEGLEGVDPEVILQETARNLFDGMPERDVNAALVMAARPLIEREPAYSQVAARLLLDRLRLDALSFVHGKRVAATGGEMAKRYADYFVRYIARASELELLDSRLANEYNLEELASRLRPERDLDFTYLGLQTLYDRYLIHSGDLRFELPQAFFMRVAMGLAINEVEREARAVEFYEALSSFDFMSSTPTLFNSGTLRPQLSSCYLTTVPDHLKGIFGSVLDNAMLSKFSGGLGNDWTRVRAMGAYIKGTNGKSQGIVPFLKVANDTAVAVNQGGKRKGAVCAYLETWHLDIEEFLELRKNTGDDRRRTHDMNTANWVPDLFMRRVAEDGDWTLLSPDEAPDLHDLHGADFERRYCEYEERAARGELRGAKQIKAVDLWRKMLSMLYETGHPWITFKDPCNLRSPQQHAGTVHSSNLCTEITLNTSDDEIAVCNLGSLNLAAHVDENGLMVEKIEKTVTTAMRMLDNVIDYNYYTVPKARASNMRHRPVGLGVMGFQDALYAQGIPYASDAAVTFADRSMELVSYCAIKASCGLARERGAYPTFEGSLWSRGILPIDSVRLLAETRADGELDQDTSTTLDWDGLRKEVRRHGMRNSNTLAIAPTATISNICGVSQSIEPTYRNLFVKSNLSGEFTVVNAHLVRALKARGLWDEVLINDLKYYDGSLGNIDRVPDDLRELYATAFEIDPAWLVRAASRRQKWIDQAQSLNLYMAEPSGRKMDALYKQAWRAGLKTTYYLRSIGATHVEKSTMADGDDSLRAVRDADAAPAAVAADAAHGAEPAPAPAEPAPAPQCLLDDPECEACQ